MAPADGIVSQDVDGTVQVAHHRVDVPVVVKISERSTPAHAYLGRLRIAPGRRDRHEPPTAGVPEYELRLSQGRIILSFRRRVREGAVGDEQVRPAVEVQVLQ